MSEPRLPDELNRLAQSLRSLQPRCDLPGRDRLMFEAGRRSRRSSGAWAATCGALSVALAFSVFYHAPVSQEPITAVVAPRSPDVVATQLVEPDAAPSGYFRTRDAVLRWGADALPSTAPAAPAPSESRPVLTPMSSRFPEDV
ncbi:MAG: hypothetical protein ACJ8C4_05990 [Gemmataceae bacterium]